MRILEAFLLNDLRVEPAPPDLRRLFCVLADGVLMVDVSASAVDWSASAAEGSVALGASVSPSLAGFTSSFAFASGALSFVSSVSLGASLSIEGGVLLAKFIHSGTKESSMPANWENMRETRVA